MDEADAQRNQPDVDQTKETGAPQRSNESADLSGKDEENADSKKQKTHDIKARNFV